jgi:ribonuclease R
VDAGGRKTGHRFGRGLMRSAARLTYEEVQQAADAGTGAGVLAERIGALYGAFRALLAARQARGTLDLDLPERRVVLDEAGRVASVMPRPRLDSHRLIEEFMVLANVAAAEELERHAAPCMYRVHDRPSEEKAEGLRAFLAQFGISLPARNMLHPRDLDGVLQRIAGTDAAPVVNEVVLRAMAQAAYAPDNIGHFGLALPRYAHFTSPIRRYADLLVHRSLVRALRLGADGLATEAAARWDTLGTHITGTERRAAAAERDALDRYLAAFMADRVGHMFQARISGVARFGLFVTLPDTGASGLIPVSSLPDDFWFHDAAQHRLSGRHTRLSFTLADPVQVRLAEAAPLTGGLVFHLVPPGGEPDRRPGRKRPRSR